MQHSKLRGLAAVGVSAAMVLVGLMAGGPRSFGAAPTYVGGGFISILDAQTGDPAVHMSPTDLPTGLTAADLPFNTGTFVTQPKIGTVLWANPGTWTDAAYFTFQWRYSTNGGSTWSTIPSTEAQDQDGNNLTVAQNFAPPLAFIGDYLQVTITAYDAAGVVTGSPLKLDTLDMGKIVGLNPDLIAAWNNTNYGATGTTRANGDVSLVPYQTTAWLTAYGYPDNTPPSGGIEGGGSGTFPKAGSSTANRVDRGIHGTGGGTGTYADPITFATDGTFELPYGTEIYVPRFQKYFISEDMCYECQGDYQGTAPDDPNTPTYGSGSNLTTPGGDGGPAMVHFDLWVGGNATNDVWQDVVQCENQLTLANDDGSAYMESIIVNPPDGLPVPLVGPIWDSTDKLCNGAPLDPSLAGNVGQFKNVAGGGTSTPHWSSTNNTTGFRYTMPYKAFDSAATVTPNGGNGSGNTANTWGNGPLSPADTETGFWVNPTGATIASGTGLCMTDHGNSTEIGTPVTMEPCADPTDTDPANVERLSSQMFTLTGSSIMINNLCIDMGFAPTGFPPPGEDAQPSGSISLSASWFTQTAAPNATNAIARQGSAPRPVTLQRCNFNANQEWEGTTNFVDMEEGYWALADLGAIGSFPDKNNPGEVIDYLYAVNINGNYGDYSSDFWDTPMSRGANDENQVNTDVTSIDPADVATTVITVSGGGLSTQSAELYLFKDDVDLATVDPDTDAVADLGSISVENGQINADGTYSATVGLPAGLSVGSYKIGVLGNYGDMPAPLSTSDSLSTSVTTAAQLGYNGMTTSSYDSPTVQGLGNFRDENFSFPTWGLSGTITLRGSGTNPNPHNCDPQTGICTDTGGAVNGTSTGLLAAAILLLVGAGAATFMARGTSLSMTGSRRRRS